MESDRRMLNFASAACSAFSYLDKLGFRCVQAEPTYVRFESDAVFVNIFHGRQSYEIGVEIGRLGNKAEEESAYRMSELIRLTDPQAASEFRNFAAQTPEHVQRGVTELANLFGKHVGNAIHGDGQMFQSLFEQRKRWAHEYALDVRASQVLPKAEEAFRQKNYAEAARLYESIQAALSEAELKKLEYAQRHSNVLGIPRPKSTDH